MWTLTLDAISERLPKTFFKAQKLNISQLARSPAVQGIHGTLRAGLVL
jgi:hypothetical protein